MRQQLPTALIQTILSFLSKEDLALSKKNSHELSDLILTAAPVQKSSEATSLLTSLVDDTMVFIDAKSHKKIASHKVSNLRDDCEFVAIGLKNGNFVFAKGSKIQVINPSDGEVGLIGMHGPALTMCQTASGLLAVGDKNGAIGLWNTEKARPTKSYISVGAPYINVLGNNLYQGPILKILLLKDDSILVLHQSCTLKQWDLATKKCIREMPLKVYTPGLSRKEKDVPELPLGVSDILALPTGEFVLFTGSTMSVLNWDTGTITPGPVIFCRDNCYAVMATGEILVWLDHDSKSSEPRIAVLKWENNTLEEISSITVDDNSIKNMAEHSDWVKMYYNVSDTKTNNDITKVSPLSMFNSKDEVTMPEALVEKENNEIGHP